MSTATISREQALDELLGNVCKGCGNAKGVGKSHCRRCYYSLPKNIRGALYRRIGQGYEAAYAESLEVLRRMKGKDAQEALPL